MKILIDAHMLGESETGNETYVANLLRALPLPGREVELLAAVAHGDAAAAVLDTTPCRRVPVSASAVRRLTLDLPAIVRRESVDLLHVTYVAPPVVACPVVVTVHDVSYGPHPEWFSPRDRFVLGCGVGFSARRAAAVITISRNSRDDICRYLRVPEERVHVIPLAAGDAFRPVPPAEVESALATLGVRRPYLLAVGSLQPRKNLGRLVQAFARLKRDGGLPHTLVMVGPAQWRETDVLDAARESGCADAIVFTGYVPEDALVRLYNGADVFVYCSLLEGFGLPILEAMACGAPVIASRAPAMPEVAGAAAMLINPLSVDDFAVAIRRVVTDPACAAELRRKGLARAAEFSWRKTADATWAVYGEVVRRHSNR